jgi:hypothetical protein
VGSSTEYFDFTEIDRTLVDTDNDGLTNDTEASIGTSSTNPDTDGDGYTDSDEYFYGSDPLDPASPGAQVLSSCTLEVNQAGGAILLASALCADTAATKPAITISFSTGPFVALLKQIDQALKGKGKPGVDFTQEEKDADRQLSLLSPLLAFWYKLIAVTLNSWTQNDNGDSDGWQILRSLQDNEVICLDKDVYNRITTDKTNDYYTDPSNFVAITKGSWVCVYKKGMDKDWTADQKAQLPKLIEYVMGKLEEGRKKLQKRLDAVNAMK